MGIWDVQSNVKAVQTVATLLHEGETDLGLICEELRVASVRCIRAFISANLNCCHCSFVTLVWL